MHNDYILESLHGGVLDIHVGVHTVPDQGLHDGVLRRREVKVSPELKMSRCIKLYLVYWKYFGHFKLTLTNSSLMWVLLLGSG